MKQITRGIMLCTLLISIGVQAQQEWVLGVVSHRDTNLLQQQYQPLADYLSQQLAPDRVQLHPLSHNELMDSLNHNRVDLLIINPSRFVQVRARNSLSGVLATLVNQHQGQTSTSMGGVIITRQDSSLKKLDDLRGASIAIPSMDGLGAYQSQAYELKQIGIDAARDTELLSVGSHDAVIEAVLNGKVQAGFLRSGILEEMSSQQKGDMPAQLRIINAQALTGYPFTTSTRLYPERFVVALSSVDDVTLRKTAAALLALEADHPAAMAAGIAGFAPPADYTAVENLAKAMKLPPYDQPDDITWLEIWQQHRTELLLTLLVLLMLSVLLALVLRYSRQLQILNLSVSRVLAEQNAILAAIPDLMFELDADGRYLSIWSQDQDMLAAQRDLLLGNRVSDMLPPVPAQTVMQAIAEALQQGTSHGQQIELLTPAGAQWFELSTSRVDCPQHKNHGSERVIMLSRNITYRKQREQQLQLAANVFSYAQEGIMITDSDNRILQVNDAFCQITGYPANEVVGKDPSLLASGHHPQSFYQQMWQQLDEQSYWQGEVWNRRRDGEVYAERLTISAIRNSQQQTVNYVALFSDITAQKRQQAHLERIAHYDALTGLANRTLLHDRLEMAIRHSNRRETLLAVVFMDLDGFKEVNDQHGHHMGDVLLKALAQRWQHLLREGDTLARLGGDEFVAVIADLHHTDELLPIVQRLLEEAATPVLADGLSLQVSASMGISFYPQHDPVDHYTLLEQADGAMYEAKNHGKNRYWIHNTQTKPAS